MNDVHFIDESTRQMARRGVIALSLFACSAVVFIAVTNVLPPLPDFKGQPGMTGQVRQTISVTRQSTASQPSDQPVETKAEEESAPEERPAKPEPPNAPATPPQQAVAQTQSTLSGDLTDKVGEASFKYDLPDHQTYLELSRLGGVFAIVASNGIVYPIRSSLERIDADALAPMNHAERKMYSRRHATLKRETQESVRSQVEYLFPICEVVLLLPNKLDAQILAAQKEYFRSRPYVAQKRAVTMVHLESSLVSGHEFWISNHRLRSTR